MGVFDSIGGGIGGAVGGLAGGIYGGISDKLGLNRLEHAEELYGGVDPSGHLGAASQQAQRFGAQQQGDVQQMTREGLAAREMLRRRAAGQDSLSAEQLRQGLGTVMAQQQGAAAGASPAGAAMAARNANMNAMQAGVGLSGQQAMAGIQERAAAEQMLNNAILQQRGQSIQGALGGQQGALQGYGAIEQNRTQRYGAAAGAPTPGEQLLGGVSGAAAMYAKSDRRAKTRIRAAEKEGRDLLASLKSYTWDYRDARDGKGRQFGFMAQDLEKTKAGRAAVVDTPGGKVVHGGKVALALAATLPGLDSRLSKLERGKR